MYKDEEVYLLSAIQKITDVLEYLNVPRDGEIISILGAVPEAIELGWFYPDGMHTLYPKDMRGVDLIRRGLELHKKVRARDRRVGPGVTNPLFLAHCILNDIEPLAVSHILWDQTYKVENSLKFIWLEERLDDDEEPEITEGARRLALLVQITGGAVDAMKTARQES